MGPYIDIPPYGGKLETTTYMKWSRLHTYEVKGNGVYPVLSTSPPSFLPAALCLHPLIVFIHLFLKLYITIGSLISTYFAF